MFRSQVVDKALIEAINAVIYDKMKHEDDIRIKPSNPEYPEQVWVELRHIMALSYHEIQRLQNTLYKRNIYGIAIYYGIDYHTNSCFFQLSLQAGELRTKFLRDE